MKAIKAQTAKRLLSLALSLAFFDVSAASAQGSNSRPLGNFEAHPQATVPADTRAPVGNIQTNPTRTPASGDGQPKWKLIAQSKDGRHYSDAGSVRRESPIVVVRQMIDYSEGFKGDFRSVIGFYAYNCNQRTMRLVSVKSYKGNMGKVHSLRNLLSQPISGRQRREMSARPISTLPATRIQ